MHFWDVENDKQIITILLCDIGNLEEDDDWEISIAILLILRIF